MPYDVANACRRIVSAAASDNAQVATVLPCRLKGVQGVVKAAADIYLKLYAGKGAAAPTSADVPVKTLCLPASGAFALDFSTGFQFDGGLSLRLTKGSADNDATVLAAGDVVGLNIDFAQ